MTKVNGPSLSTAEVIAGNAKHGHGQRPDDRAKNFLAVYLHVRFCAGEDRRLDDVVSAAASAQEAGSGAHRFVNPGGGTDGVTFANEWANVGGLIHRITGLQLLDGFDQQVGEFSIDGLFDQNALHGYAGLASIGEAAYDAAFGSIGDISVAVDQDGGIASEFENDFLFPSATLDVPSYGDAAGEADELDALVGD